MGAPRSAEAEPEAEPRGPETHPASPAASGSPLERAYERSLDCVHCGLCLPVCPTYRETGRETSSPRGRIYLARGAAEGRIPLGAVVADEMHLCLGCRACETACPSGVRFGAMLEDVREAVADHGLRRGVVPGIERFALRALVAHPARLRAVVTLVVWGLRLRLDRWLGPLLPERLRSARDLLGRPPGRAERRRLPDRIAAVGEVRGRVALLEGCIMPELFGRVNAATARVLALNGFEVSVPPGQGCCGALSAHAGLAGLAREQLERNLEAFDDDEASVIVSNSAGCGAAMRDAGEWLPGRAEAFAARVRDVSELLAAEGLRAPMRPLGLRVAYDDPCHLVHGQGVRDAPRRLLDAIPGLERIVHDDPGGCCGAAGTYNLTQPEMSRAVLEPKIRAIVRAAPDVVATGNPGCMMQLRAGLARAGSPIRVAHPIELLDEATVGDLSVDRRGARIG